MKVSLACCRFEILPTSTGIALVVVAFGVKLAFLSYRICCHDDKQVERVCVLLSLSLFCPVCVRSLLYPINCTLCLEQQYYLSDLFFLKGMKGVWYTTIIFTCA